MDFDIVSIDFIFCDVRRNVLRQQKGTHHIMLNSATESIDTLAKGYVISVDTMKAIISFIVSVDIII